MLKLARENEHKAGVANAEFLTGEMEVFPPPDDHVAVVNKRQRHHPSAATQKVLGEAFTFRVLKPGGQFAVSDSGIGGNLRQARGRTCDGRARRGHLRARRIQDLGAVER